MINVVIINGGRGAGTLIPALKRRGNISLTSIVNAYDDGKSTGEVRRHFSMLGPSDIRKVQELLLPESAKADHARKIFNQRYPSSISNPDVKLQLERFASGASDYPFISPKIESGRLIPAFRAFIRRFLDHLKISEKVIAAPFEFSDCSLLNCIYGGAFLYLDRDLSKSVAYINQLLEIEGRVLVAGLDNKHLAALREDGEILYCEADIVEQRSNSRISQLVMLDEPLVKGTLDGLNEQEKKQFLESRHSTGDASQPAQRALRDADIIIYAAGTQHSSLYPTYLLRGIADAIGENRKALKVFVTNIGADYETPDYLASDYIIGAFRYLRASTGTRWLESDLFTYNLVNDGVDGLHSSVCVDLVKLDKHPVPLVLKQLTKESHCGRHDGDLVVDIVMDLHRERLDKVII